MGSVWGWLIGDKGDMVENSVQKCVYVDEKCRKITQNKEVEAEFEQRTKMPKACIYAGFRHLFYQMALVWLYLWAG